MQASKSQTGLYGRSDAYSLRLAAPPSVTQSFMGNICPPSHQLADVSSMRFERGAMSDPNGSPFEGNPLGFMWSPLHVLCMGNPTERPSCPQGARASGMQQGTPSAR